MNEHSEMRELLALAACGALEPAQERALEAHARDCADCAAEWDRWRALAGDLKRLPTPQAPAALVARTRIRILAQLSETNARRENLRILAFLVFFAWTTTLLTWFLIRPLGSQVASWFDLRLTHQWIWFAVYVGFGWFSAAAAAVLLGARGRMARRVA